MDEMKIKLSTRLMRGLVAKIISKSISKKLGCKASIHLNEIEIELKGENASFHVSADGELKGISFTKISRILDED